MRPTGGAPTSPPCTACCARLASATCAPSRRHLPRRTAPPAPWRTGSSAATPSGPPSTRTARSSTLASSIRLHAPRFGARFHPPPQCCVYWGTCICSGGTPALELSRHTDPQVAVALEPEVLGARTMRVRREFFLLGFALVLAIAAFN